MNEQAIAIFCIGDEVVKSFGFVENPHYKMMTAEVMTVAIVGALFFGRNFSQARRHAKKPQLYIKYALVKVV